MKIRYGENCAESFQILDYGKKLLIDNIEITFYPAGHILGSAQILIEKKGYKFVVTGDYKTKKDPTANEFELLKCHTLITEATFGLPIFKHPDPKDEIIKILKSKKLNKKNHLIGVYALGKAQRLVRLLRENGFDDTIYIHGSLEKINNFYVIEGIKLGKLKKIYSKEVSKLKNEIILAPPSALRDRWSRKLGDVVLSKASGWMNIKQRVKQGSIEVPLIISDHSDWDEITDTIKNSQAENIWVTHGREDGLVHWCRTQGLNSIPLALVGRNEDSGL